MKKITHTLLEAGILLMMSMIVALAVNGSRTQGLDLKRDHFRRISVAADDSPDSSNTAPLAMEHSFKTVTLEEAYEYNEQGDSSIVFIDARDDKNYEQCHVPNAIQFDYYHPDQYLPGVLDFALDAEVVIIYCNGGTCEDSILAAQYLTQEIDTPLEMDMVYVFEGGIKAWRLAKYPGEGEECYP